MRTDVLHVGFDSLTMSEAVETAFEKLETGTGEYIVTPNAEIVWMCRKDKRLGSIIENAAMVLPDSVGVMYGSRILKRPLKEKVPGVDFAVQLFERMQNSGKTAFLFGAKPGVAELAAEKLRERFPGLIIAGTQDGYFTDNSAVIEKINAAKPDLLLVCLGAPKQEYWMEENAAALDVKLMAGLGGSLDVFAGVVERAPEKWQKRGLEWLYRLKKEPRRIKRMIKLPLFLFGVCWQRIRGK